MVAHICTLCTLEAKAGGLLRAERQPEPQSEVKASWGYILRSCLKKTYTKEILGLKEGGKGEGKG